MKLTPPQIRAFKQDGRKIAMLTVYDYPSASILDEAGIDILLVGDSLGNVVQGKSTTLPVTIDEILYHAEMVARAAHHALVVVDLPFPYCQLGPKEAIHAAVRIIKETLADAVKLEGGANRAETIAALTDAGIPVLGHCGVRPQDIRQTGGYSIQRQRDLLFEDVKAVEKAGAFGVVLECLQSDIAKEVTKVLSIPTIGIGSGNDTDGQVLVFHDVLGYTPFGDTKVPKHVKQYVNLRTIITGAVKQYADEVRRGEFP
jgi:3-methyl-2-oxobutanoate hydroxymethyltransferase